MKSLFEAGHQTLIGVVHLLPLPGSPRWQGNLEQLIEFAVNDADSYERGGANAVCIENFGDVPFTKSSVAPETIAAMAAAGRAIRAKIKLPLGFNVLRNDARAALALSAACAGNFIRVNVHTGAMLTDQGLIEGDAYETLRYRERVCPGAQILADVHVKHAVTLGNWPPIWPRATSSNAAWPTPSSSRAPALARPRTFPTWKPSAARVPTQKFFWAAASPPKTSATIRKPTASSSEVH